MAVRDARRPWATPDGAREFVDLWLVALATYGVGDIVTTLALRVAPGPVAEANPVVAVALATGGHTGFAAAKFFAFVAAIALSVAAGRRALRACYYAPPAVLAVVGAYASTHNVSLVLA